MVHEQRALDSPRSWRLLALTVLALISCARSARDVPGLDPIPAPDLPPASIVRDLPLWVDEPRRHPTLPPAQVVAAVGRSRYGPIDAGNAALDALVDSLVTLVEASRRLAAPLHPYFAYAGEFARGVDRRLEPSSPLVAGVLGGAALDTLGRVVHERRSYAFAYLDRARSAARLDRRHAVIAGRVEEAVDIAVTAAELDNWFGFVRWSRAALDREAERVATLIVREAIAPGVDVGVFEHSRRLRWIGIVADTLEARHGFTFRAEFDWQDEPPRQMELRIKRHLVRLLIDEGLRVGIGEGCPKLSSARRLEWPVEEEEGEEPDREGPIDPEAPLHEGRDGSSTGDTKDDGAEEVEEPAPHHVLGVRSRGAVTRTAMATWEAVVDITIEAVTCGMGTIVEERRLISLAGVGRDAQAAYLRALDWSRADAHIERALREIDLVPPDEMVTDPPRSGGAF